MTGTVLSCSLMNVHNLNINEDVMMLNLIHAQRCAYVQYV